MIKRIQTFQQWLNEEKIDAAIITSTENVFYFSRFYSDPHERLLAIVLFQREEPFLICPLMEATSAKDKGWDYPIFGYKDTEDPLQILTDEIKKRVGNGTTFAVEKNHINAFRYETLQRQFPRASFKNAEDQLNQQRLIKDDAELEKLEKAAELADYAIRVGINEIKEGVTELQIVAAIEYELKKKGVEKMSFPTIVLTGEKAASPHGTPGLTKVKKGDFVLFDLGVVYEGYCSDITRTVHYGGPTKKQGEIYETVLRAQEKAISMSRPGVSCGTLDMTARKIISEAGYGEYFTHRLGHGLGISVHEFPSITESNPLPLKKGMVFTIEPGIYIPNEIGVRIEDDVVVTDHEALSLTRFPKQLQIIS
ncbi:M24 family metallopeptidase [Fervidibacillus halotolerans]|uniref:Xaa-Pro peptidase family protein n=1 Tax=Fervidibacillus halotolerans TaxID=2980027 RepID=A0A9E8LXR3_9BACI|nr:Xaa-Pro peptidase family protein [Fervidibacillus halotolerans]WAA11678.1 Xaa-Pro peptidase family protein [Fervidibacillus halotolerans]